ncbi:MAG TPA: hypothetical protein VJO12_00775 [Stellaceae bacterium]|nr:hypothetical protein [Stellaceae bacterium]
MSGSPSLLIIQLLSWLAARPRSHAELKEAWRSTCPLTCAWEDAFNDGLVALTTGGERSDGARIVLTPRGRAALAAAEERRQSPPAPFALDPARARL